MITALAITALVLAGGPAALFVLNLLRYRTPPAPPAAAVLPSLSVLVPARDEEANIEAILGSVLASEGVELEVVVLDDHSQDHTVDIVQRIAAADPRVRLERAPPLPPGWNGKQHACWVLAGLARHELLVFVDADVVLEPTALARMAGFMERSGAALASGAPRQRTTTLGERLIVPLIHFVLLSFLPLGRMRRSTHPAYASGIGQLFIARRDAYQRAGGHAAIRGSRHDGIGLPRTFRIAGSPTDLFDATQLATCHMYGSFGDVWRGFAKNADEGMGAPAAIVPFTLLLGLGQVLPFLLLPLTPWLPPGVSLMVILAVGAAWTPRLLAVWRFEQPLVGALMHPLGVALLLAIQWYALALRLSGNRVAWKGRLDKSQTLPEGPS